MDEQMISELRQEFCATLERDRRDIWQQWKRYGTWIVRMLSAGGRQASFCNRSSERSGQTV